MTTSNSDFISNRTAIQYFHDRWNQCKQIIDDNGQSGTSIQTVFQYIDEILNKLIDEPPPKLTTDELYAGPLLESVIQNDIFQCLLIWAEANPTLKDKKFITTRDTLRFHLLKSFEKLITQSRQPVLLHRTILQPLLQTLLKLSSQLHGSYYEVFGRVLNELCILLCRDPKLYEFCKELSLEIFSQPYLVFSLLVPLLHRQDSVGDSSRDALLLLFVLSKHDNQLGHYLAYESDMCPVLATGLSGLYSTLPKKLIARHNLSTRNANSLFCLSEPGQSSMMFTTPNPANHGQTTNDPCLLTLQVGGPEWHQLTETEWANSSDLRRFLHTLDFCNLAVKIAHPHVQTQLAHYIHSGFLVPVLGSALHQNATDEVIAATAYLELMLRRLTEPILIKLLLKFIMTGHHDSYQILTSLMNRLAANAVLGMVTLSLFRTILNFDCEDVMYELIFKHLLSLNHLNMDATQYHSDKLTDAVEPPIVHHLSWSGRKGFRHPSNKPKSMQSTVYLPASINTITMYTNLIKSADSFYDLSGISLMQASSCDQCGVMQPMMCTRSQRLVNSTFNVHRLGSESKPCSTNHARSHSDLYSDPLLTDSNEPLDSDRSNTIDSSLYDWVKIHRVNTPETVNHYGALLTYIRNAKSRINRRSIACKSWSSTYWPRQSPTIGQGNSVFTDYGPLTEFNYQLNPLNPSLPAADESYICAITQNSDCELPLTLSSSLKVTRTSSLYQLNYLDDFSDDEFIQENQTKLHSNMQDESSKAKAPTDLFVSHSRSSVSSSNSCIIGAATAKFTERQSVSHNPFRVCRRYVCGDGRIPCTCLANLPELLKVADSASPTSLQRINNRLLICDSNVQSSTNITDMDYELENFLAALDCLPSPGHCENHFGHLGPIISHPKLDEQFMEKLNLLYDGNHNVLPVNKLTSMEIDLPANEQQETTTTNEFGYCSNDLDSVSLNEACMSNSSSPSMSTTLTMTTSTIGAEYGISKQNLNLNNSNSTSGIGLFLSILLSRLSNMHINCLFTNLLLTDILSALASYPCPLLYGFLLNHVDLPVKQSTNTLYKVLRSVRNQISVAASSIDNWPILIQRAKIYLDGQFKQELKMTIIPDFYTAKNGSRLSRAQRSSRSDATPGYSSSCSNNNSTPSPNALPIPNAPSHKSSQLTPLFPVVYPKSFHKVHSPSRHPSFFASGSRLYHILDITCRIAQTPVLKRGSLNQLPSLFSGNHKTKVNSESEDEYDHDTLDGTKTLPDSTTDNVNGCHIPARIRNLVFAAIIFDEFCCELAGLCYEHSLKPI